jgi:hypothetical protein
MTVQPLDPADYQALLERRSLLFSRRGRRRTRNSSAMDIALRELLPAVTTLGYGAAARRISLW